MQQNGGGGGRVRGVNVRGVARASVSIPSDPNCLWSLQWGAPAYVRVHCPPVYLFSSHPRAALQNYRLTEGRGGGRGDAFAMLHV